MDRNNTRDNNMIQKITCPHCGEEITVDILANVNLSAHVLDEPASPKTDTDSPQEQSSMKIPFEELLASFNTVLLGRGYKQVSFPMEVYGYLTWAYSFARGLYLAKDSDKSWMFHDATYPREYNNGSSTDDEDIAYNAMQAWLMASILAELVPDCGTTTNTQTKLFALAYSYGGANYPLYNRQSLACNPYFAREAASIIYAIVRGDKNISKNIDTYRSELGGHAIPATVWDDLKYKNEILFDSQHRRLGYKMDYLGYCINTRAFLPDAPGPRISGTTVCDLPKPWDQGQDKTLFNEDTGNYLIDEAIYNHMVSEWNMMSQTPLSTWECYSIEKRNRLVNACATISCTYNYMFGKPKKIKFTGIKNKTYNGSTYANYFTFEETNEDTGLVLDGPFSNLTGLYRYNVSSKNEYETLIERVTDIADNFRFPTQDPNYGRCRPGCSPTLEGGEKVPVHGAPENELYNIDIAAMVADNETRRQKVLHEDGFARDSPRSYVSGHSAQLWTLGLLFTQMDNDNTDRPREWMRKAFDYSTNRTITRFHWNSDCIYGRLFGAMCLPIINAMSGLQEGLKSVKEYVMNPTNQQEPSTSGSWSADIIVKNLTGGDIQSTGEIRLYVKDHIGVNVYLPGAKATAGAKYTFKQGETVFSSQGIHCVLNGEDYITDDYDNNPITEVRFYDYRHWKNTDAGYKAEIDLTDSRGSSIIKKKGSTYVIKITSL